MRSAGIAWVDRAGVIAEARRLAAEMRAAHGEVRRVLLYGSFARGGGGPRSDLDLVVIVEATSLRPRNRIAHYLPVSSRPIDMTVYTLTEVERFAGSPPAILREALARGIDLLADDAPEPGGARARPPADRREHA